MTRVLTLLIISACGCAAGACSVTDSSIYRPIHQGRITNGTREDSPTGMWINVMTEVEWYGELIEVRQDGIILLTDRKLRLLPYQAIRSSKISAFRFNENILKGRAPEPRVLQQLRLVSRYPQGLAPELLQQLLLAYGQTEMAGTIR